MNAILFDPETSIRRALILALGDYDADSLSPAERDRLIDKLLDWYVNDPDAGIHGAAEWTLRQWKQADKLRSSQAGLPGFKDRGPRRWFVNSQGQTFAMIHGSVEFRMGSPPGEPDRDPDETSHQRVIPRSFAMAVKEVTVAQYQQFVKENPPFSLAQSYLDKYSPDPNGPITAVSWFGAAAYCNWLSKQEGLAESQWCYLRNAHGEYDAGMTIPADAFQRTGYRLPSEAEWEYACRAGAVTSRYHGLSVALLQAYARYASNSSEHAWPAGGMRPNDLGLFDMLGNVYEWCQERQEAYSFSRIGSIDTEVLDVRIYRPLRGGAFGNLPGGVRSANRDRDLPSDRDTDGGFRLARTCN
jgi:formylglycine-generating enzyme required for sulfatase activity